MTAAERAAWAAAGALATLAALAGLAVHWGRAVERNEAYGTHMATPGGGRIIGPGTRDGDVPVVLSRGGPVCKIVNCWDTVEPDLFDGYCARHLDELYGRL